MDPQHQMQQPEHDQRKHHQVEDERIHPLADAADRKDQRHALGRDDLDAMPPAELGVKAVRDQRHATLRPARLK
jgi:hypothetical protein